MATIDSPGGPHVLPQTVRGDHMFCHRQSGGTTFRGDQLKYDSPQFGGSPFSHDTGTFTRSRRLSGRNVYASVFFPAERIR